MLVTLQSDFWQKFALTANILANMRINKLTLTEKMRTKASTNDRKVTFKPNQAVRGGKELLTASDFHPLPQFICSESFLEMCGYKHIPNYLRILLCKKVSLIPISEAGPSLPSIPLDSSDSNLWVAFWTLTKIKSKLFLPNGAISLPKSVVPQKAWTALYMLFISCRPLYTEALNHFT